MLTKQEEDFIVYWAKQRDTYRQSFVEFVKGMSVGLGISAAIIVVVITGWFERANMVANSKMSAIVFALALLIITVFMAWLYRNFQWENKEQQYLELLAKRDRSKPSTLEEPLSDTINHNS
ncbi:hypothetical protein ACFOW1_10895 [Parasediminibacterium paludis]|uniref:Uncharacterized protein n=1 Tax=Parasediminibacterium paludis TaxID=908966 RepID=A0ABV8PY86_9BACT